MEKVLVHRKEGDWKLEIVRTYDRTVGTHEFEFIASKNGIIGESLSGTLPETASALSEFSSRIPSAKTWLERVEITC